MIHSGLKSYIVLPIKGRDLAAPVLTLWAVAVLVIGTIVAALSVSSLTASPWLDAAAGCILFLLLTALRSWTELRLLGALSTRLRIERRALSYRSRLTEYALLSARDALFSILTLGIYLPWSIGSKMRYWARHTSSDEIPFEFAGRGTSLFIRSLPAMLGIAILTAFFAYIGVTHPAGQSADELVGFVFLALFLLFLFLLAVSTYLLGTWMVGVRRGGTSLRWQGSFRSSIGVFFGQVALSVLTAGFYLPVAIVRLSAHLFREATLERDGQLVRRLGFDSGENGLYRRIWAQAALSFVTAGIYLPWAVARILAMVAQSAYLELPSHDDRLKIETREDEPTIAQANWLVSVSIALIAILAGSLAHIVRSALAMLISELAFIVPLLVWLLVRRLPVRQTLRLNPVSLTTGLWSAAIGLVCWPIAAVLGALSEIPLSAIGHYPSTSLPSSVVGWILFVLTLSVAAPLVEEPLYRGFVLRAWSRRGVAVGIVVSGILFGLSHFQLRDIVPLSLLGIVFAMMALRTQSIVSPMLAHATYNGAATLFSALVSGSGETRTGIFLLSFLAAGVPLFVLLFRGFLRSDSTASEGEPAGRQRLPDRSLGPFVILFVLLALVATSDVFIRLNPSLSGLAAGG